MKYCPKSSQIEWKHDTSNGLTCGSSCSHPKLHAPLLDLEAPQPGIVLSGADPGIAAAQLQGPQPQRHGWGVGACAANGEDGGGCCEAIVIQDWDEEIDCICSWTPPNANQSVLIHFVHVNKAPSQVNPKYR